MTLTNLNASKIYHKINLTMIKYRENRVFEKIYQIMNKKIVMGFYVQANLGVGEIGLYTEPCISMEGIWRKLKRMIVCLCICNDV